jgi:hypothetical protein
MKFGLGCAGFRKLQHKEAYAAASVLASLCPDQECIPDSGKRIRARIRVE